MKDAFLLSYSKYPLKRVLTIDEIVTADYVTGKVFDTPHFHENAVELIYCISGSFTVFRDGIPVTMQSRDVLLVTPGMMHEVRSEKPDNVLFVISFHCASNYLSILYNARFTVSDRQEEWFREINRELRRAFRLNAGEMRLFTFRPNSKSPLGAEQMICCYLEQIMISFLRDATTDGGRIVESRHFNSAILKYMIGQINDYVLAHLSENITVSDIAEAFHYSRSRLSTIYKETTGLGLAEYITKERIARARQLLTEGNMTVTEVSEALGFSSPEYFSRRFSQCVGIPPSRYAQVFREKSRTENENKSAG